MLINPMIKLETDISYVDRIRFSPHLSVMYNYWNELWAPITSITVPNVVEGLYWISTFGRVVSYARPNPIFLTNTLSNTGYYRVCLKLTNNTQRYQLIHRIVLGTFFPIVGMDVFQVNHINGIRTFNCIWNLEWVTAKENINHSINNLGSTYRNGETNTNATITNAQADYIGKLLLENELTHQQIADIVGCTVFNVNNISAGNCRIDVFNKYGLKDLVIRNRFSKTDVHNICALFVELGKPRFGCRDTFYSTILAKLGFDINVENKRALERIYYKITHIDISSMYSY